VDDIHESFRHSGLIATAYIESYRGPHDKELGAAETGTIDVAVPAAIVTPAVLSAHYRLGRGTARPAQAASPSTTTTIPPALGPRCRWSTDHGGC